MRSSTPSLVCASAQVQTCIYMHPSVPARTQSTEHNRHTHTHTTHTLWHFFSLLQMQKHTKTRCSLSVSELQCLNAVQTWLFKLDLTPTSTFRKSHLQSRLCKAVTCTPNILFSPDVGDIHLMSKTDDLLYDYKAICIWSLASASSLFHHTIKFDSWSFTIWSCD